MLAELQDIFGDQPNGCRARPRFGDCMMNPIIVRRCVAAMKSKSADLFDYFERWDESDPNFKPHDIERLLALNGRWEAAWSLARLHVDQIVKRELATGKRVAAKGHALCNVALVGHAIGASSLVRHYGQLSSAGDIYDCDRDGPAPVLLEPHESRRSHEDWRNYVRGQIGNDRTKPRYLEAYVAARWFRGKHRDAIAALAPMLTNGQVSFVDLLLDGACGPKNKTKGTFFEAAAGLLLSATPGFTVYPCRWNRDDQIDLVVRYHPDTIAPACLPSGYGLVECKAEINRIDAPTIRDFGAKCQFHRVGLGILVTMRGITKGTNRSDPVGAELVRRRFLNDGLTLLVLDMDAIRNRDCELRGLHDELMNDYQRLVFGQIVGE